MIYQTLLLQMIGWVFGIGEYKIRNDADAKSLEIIPIQITLESLWDATKDATIYHIFEVHQFEMKITRKNLCDRLSIGERMYRPPNKEQRTEHLNDDIDYRKQIIHNPQIWEALETAANTGQFRKILCAAQGMEAPSKLGASHLGSPNPNPFTSVQVDSAAALVDNIQNQIADIRSEVDTNNDNRNNDVLTITNGEITLGGNETTSQSLVCKEPDSSLQTQQSQTTGASRTNNGTNTIQKRKERSLEETGMKHKKPNTQTTPTFGNAPIIPVRDRTLDYGEAKSFKTAFSQPTSKSPYYRDYAPHLKIKPYRGDRIRHPESKLYSLKFDQKGISFFEKDNSGNQIKYFRPQEDLYRRTTIGHKCLICPKETMKENAMISHVRTHYLKN